MLGWFTSSICLSPLIRLYSLDLILFMQKINFALLAAKVAKICSLIHVFDHRDSLVCFWLNTQRSNNGSNGLFILLNGILLLDCVFERYEAMVTGVFSWAKERGRKGKKKKKKRCLMPFALIF